MPQQEFTNFQNLMALPTALKYSSRFKEESHVRLAKCAASLDDKDRPT
jgi:hypothetical protein